MKNLIVRALTGAVYVLLLVGCTCVNLETVEGCSTDGVVGEHTLDCQFENSFRLGLHQLVCRDELQTADVTGMMVVHLIGHLLTGENSLGCVDDNDVIAAVNMRGVGGLVLAVENGSCERCGLTDGLACCVDDIPCAFQSFLFSHESGHDFFLRYCYRCRRFMCGTIVFLLQNV